MLKKIFALLLALALLTAGGNALAEQTLDFNGAFTITCSDKWQLDREYDAESATETFACLGALDTAASRMEICVYDDRANFEDFTVPDKECADYYAYVSQVFAVIEAREDTRDCTLVGSCLSGDGKANFVIVRVDDGDGGFYYADTMIGGCTLALYGYSSLSLVETGERQLAEIKSVIGSMTFNDTLF